MPARNTPQVAALVALGIGTALAGRQLVRRARRFDLAGKVAVVTGGSRGLGLLIARELASRGARVAACARDEAELERARRQLAAEGHELFVAPCDVSDAAEVEQFVGRVQSELGHVDVLVNNAGIITVGPAETMTLKDYQDAMGANFWGAVLMTREVVDGMRRRGRGRIVNVASIGGKCSVPHLLPYSASKFALVGWSEGLRAELQRDDVYVSTIVPGLVRTGSPRNALFKGKHRQEYAWFALGDALPFTSMDARRAAARIVDASVYGEAEVILSWQAKLTAAFHGLFPGLSSELAGIANRLLPANGGAGTAGRRGWQSESAVTPSVLTSLSDRAAEPNNELPA